MHVTMSRSVHRKMHACARAGMGGVEDRGGVSDVGVSVGDPGVAAAAESGAVALAVAGWGGGGGVLPRSLATAFFALSGSFASTTELFTETARSTAAFLASPFAADASDAGRGHVRLAAADPLGWSIRQIAAPGGETPATRAGSIQIAGGENGRVQIAGRVDVSDREAGGVGGTIDVTGETIVLKGDVVDDAGGEVDSFGTKPVDAEEVRVGLPVGELVATVGSKDPVQALVRSLRTTIAERERLESDMESMNGSALRLLEQVSMMGETLPRLSAGGDDTEIVALGLRACHRAAGVERVGTRRIIHANHPLTVNNHQARSPQPPSIQNKPSTPAHLSALQPASLEH